MAVAAPVEQKTDDVYRDSIAWYRKKLAEPAVFPWAECRWPPKLIGPTWQTDRSGRWVLPEASLGWQVIGWTSSKLQLRRGEPWRFTLEQARFVLWWYALAESGDWLFTDGVLQRIKGAGKDPMAAVLSLAEALGPVRCGGWDGDSPVAVDVPEAWVQLAAVSLEQTKNTTRLFPSLLPEATRAEYRIRVGKELIWAEGDERLIQAVTSSPATLEGARTTAVYKNETHHWNGSNDGHSMADVIERNAVKTGARPLAITNAYQPGEDSSAERDREAFELADGGGTVAGLTTLYDSLEAPPEAPLSAEAAPDVLVGVRGDSVWLDVDRIVGSILDTRNPPSRSRRFWYNQVTAAEESWVDPIHFAVCARRDLGLQTGDEVVAFFDGSKSDDATGLVAARLSDGLIVTLGMWQRPPGERGAGWLAPKDLVDAQVEAMFAAYRVSAFFADPSHALEDETEERYWDALLDRWHHRHGKDLLLWATPKHSVMWDMTSQPRQREFVAACERVEGEISASHAETEWGRPPTFVHDGDARLVRHVGNAYRRPGKYGVGMGKKARGSRQKIDLAVCMVGAAMLRRRIMLGEGRKRRSGKVW